MVSADQVNATLRAVQQEKDNLENKLKIEHGARKELEGKHAANQHSVRYWTVFDPVFTLRLHSMCVGGGGGNPSWESQEISCLWRLCTQIGAMPTQ